MHDHRKHKSQHNQGNEHGLVRFTLRMCGVLVLKFRTLIKQCLIPSLFLYSITLVVLFSQLVKLFRRCIADINKCGGLVRDFENMSVRILSYKMRLHQQVHSSGQYVRLTFQGSPNAKNLVEFRLRADDQVVRYLTLAKKDIAAKAPPKPPALPPPKMGAVEADFLRMATGS